MLFVLLMLLLREEKDELRWVEMKNERGHKSGGKGAGGVTARKLEWLK